MQYQFAGQDALGRLIYQPVQNGVQQPVEHQHQQQPYMAQPASCSCHGCGVQPAKKKAADGTKSFFETWFVMEDGVISVSLRNLTIACSALISVTLLLILYASCNDGTGDYVCTLEKWPMISDVINQEMYNRTFILLTAIFMFGVQQVNLRAFYKLLYGKVSNGRNDTMMWFGIISMVGLPMVGIFDESLWKTLHGISAGMFFIGFMIYARLLACAMHEVRSQFDQDTQVSIASMYSNVTNLILVTLGFFVSLGLKGAGGITAILEWGTALYFVNFFSIASFANPFYDSVHQPGTLVPTEGKKEESA
jgi:hypothetical protein